MMHTHLAKDLDQVSITNPAAHGSRRRPGATFTLAALAGALLLGACGGGGDGGSADPSAADSDGAGQQQALAVAANTGLVPAPAGLRGNVTCRNQIIGAVALDTVSVAPNTACRLEGTLLQGAVLVGQGASLDAVAIRSNGSVQAEGAAHVALSGGSQIIGSVQLRQGGSASVSGNSITGDLQVESMRSTVLAGANAVGGSLQAIGNRGGLTLRDNRIQGNLQCSENLPAPVFSGNLAASADGQCLGGASGGTGGGSTGGGTGGSTPPLSGNVTCIGLSIGALRLDSVTVPAGASCTLQGTLLNGNLEVGAGAQLVAQGVQVTGGLTADGAAALTLGSSARIGGSVQLKQGGSASLSGASIGGDLQIDAMRGAVSASGNQVRGNLQAMANRGGLQLLANTMGGTMQCKDNLPAPTGSGNRASQKQDQCRGL